MTFKPLFKNGQLERMRTEAFEREEKRKKEKLKWIIGWTIIGITVVFTVWLVDFVASL